MMFKCTRNNFDDSKTLIKQKQMYSTSKILTVNYKNNDLIYLDKNKIESKTITKHNVKPLVKIKSTRSLSPYKNTKYYHAKLRIPKKKLNIENNSDDINTSSNTLRKSHREWMQNLSEEELNN